MLRKQIKIVYFELKCNVINTIIYTKLNPERYNSTGQILSLLFKGHQFESHKPQGHWRLTWSLTSGLV
jgi:hypothetical protein